jgi:hypothetical protein
MSAPFDSPPACTISESPATTGDIATPKLGEPVENSFE